MSLAAIARRHGMLDLSMERAEYDRVRRVNWSTLKHLARSPAHYQRRLLEPESDTDAKRFGRVVHLAVLEPGRFATEVAVWTGGRRQGKEWDAFCERYSGVEILTQAEHARCLAIQQAARTAAPQYLTGGVAEVTALWAHELPTVGGLPVQEIHCKSRLDYVTDGCLADLKTTRDASPDGFGREAWRYKYATQAAMYQDAYEACTGRRLPFVLVAVESEAPHVVQVYRIPDVVLDIGRDEYRDLLERLAFCRSENRWPGYADGELELSLPRWAVGSSEDDDLSGLDLIVND